MFQIIINKFKKFIPYYLWIEFISIYQRLKFKIIKKYSCRGDIDKELINIIGDKKMVFF